MDLGKAIRTCRQSRNWTQGELAAKLDISVSYLSMIEKGSREPNVDFLSMVSKAFGIPIVLLVFLGESPEEQTWMPADLSEKMAAAALRAIQQN